MGVGYIYNTLIISGERDEMKMKKVKKNEGGAEGRGERGGEGEKRGGILYARFVSIN